VRLISAQYVKPFLKLHKNDCRNGEVIAEAVQRAAMQIVAIETTLACRFQTRFVGARTCRPAQKA
jgi:transposase